MVFLCPNESSGRKLVGLGLSRFVARLHSSFNTHHDRPSILPPSQVRKGLPQVVRTSPNAPQFVLLSLVPTISPADFACVRSRVCNAHQGLIRKYHLMMCRRCFRERAVDIGFEKVPAPSQILVQASLAAAPCCRYWLCVLLFHQTTGV